MGQSGICVKTRFSLISEYTASVALLSGCWRSASRTATPLLALRGGWGPEVMNFKNPTMTTPNQNTIQKSSRKRSRSSLWTYGDMDSSDEYSDQDDIDIVCHEEAKKDEPWPKFLVIEARDEKNPLSKVSPFLISKAIEGMVGTTQQIKKLGNGALLVEKKRKKSVGETSNVETLGKYRNSSKCT